MTGYTHSQKSSEHYTQPDVCEAARLALGAIDLDPASCAAANRTVKAARFFTVEDDGLSQRWHHIDGSLSSLFNPFKPSADCDVTEPDMKIRPARVLINYPGTHKGAGLVWWNKLIEEYDWGRVESAVWVGYALNSLAMLLQREPSPLAFPTCFYRGRMRFDHPTAQLALDGLPATEEGSKPNHGNYLTFLPPKDPLEQDRAMPRWAAAFEPLGALMVPCVHEARWRTIVVQQAIREGVAMERLLGGARDRHTSAARKRCWAALHAAGFSHGRIAAIFDRDRTTVLAGIRTAGEEPT